MMPPAYRREFPLSMQSEIAAFRPKRSDCPALRLTETVTRPRPSQFAATWSLGSTCARSLAAWMSTWRITSVRPQRAPRPSEAGSCPLIPGQKVIPRTSSLSRAPRGSRSRHRRLFPRSARCLQMTLQALRRAEAAGSLRGMPGDHRPSNLTIPLQTGSNRVEPNSHRFIHGDRRAGAARRAEAAQGLPPFPETSYPAWLAPTGWRATPNRPARTAGSAGREIYFHASTPPRTAER